MADAKKTDKAAKAPAKKAAAPVAAPKAVAAPKVAKVKKPKVAKTPVAPHKSTDDRGFKRTLTGFVRSDKMDKTVVVEVVTLKRDSMYGKYLRERSRYKAHDEKNQYKTGDKVEISEHRPLSREKRWIVSKLLVAAKVE